jgi:hypothetical protein
VSNNCDFVAYRSQSRNLSQNKKGRGRGKCYKRKSRGMEFVHFAVKPMISECGLVSLQSHNDSVSRENQSGI